MVLNRAEARKYYDRFGAKQDSQAFYEDPALDDLIAHADFGSAESVCEFGCGTGRLALQLLSNYLPSSASYMGSDVSETMVHLARQKVAPFGARARIEHTDGAIQFDLPDNSVNRVVSTYVLDLLSDDDMRKVITESGRVLKPGGKLCLVSLTVGRTAATRIVSALWAAVYHLRASLVGGCRPIRLRQLFQAPGWEIGYQNIVSRFGIASEVLIASKTSGPGA